MLLGLRASGRGGAAVWMAAGFAGVCLVLQPSLGSGDPAGVVYGLLSGLTGAFCYLLLGRLGHAGEPQRVTAFWFSAIACALAFVPTLARGFTAVTAEQLALVLAIGVLATFAQLAVVKAYAIGSPLIPSTLSYSAVIFSSILGTLWWGDQLGVAEALGIALIVASGVLVSAGQASAGAPRADAQDERRKREYRKNNLRSVYAVYRLAKDPGQTRFVFMISTAQDNIADCEKIMKQLDEIIQEEGIERQPELLLEIVPLHPERAGHDPRPPDDGPAAPGHRRDPRAEFHRDRDVGARVGEPLLEQEPDHVGHDRVVVPESQIGRGDCAVLDYFGGHSE